MGCGKKLLIGCGGLAAIVAVLVFAGLVVIGILVESGTLPNTLVLRGDEIPDHQRRSLEKIGVVEADEEILYFYSAGILSVEEDGNLLTETHVISYERLDGEPDIYSARYEEITNIVRETEGAFWEDALVRVDTEGGGYLYLYLSIEDGRDEDFLDALNTKWEEHRDHTRRQKTGAKTGKSR